MNINPSATQANGWMVQPFARTLAKTLQESGLPTATEDKVTLTLDRLAHTGLTREKIVVLQDLFGESRWTTGTFSVVAKTLDSVCSWRPSLPGSGQPDVRPAALKLLASLTAPPRQKITTVQQLGELGYTTQVAEQLLEQQPALVDDLAQWSQAEPTMARPKELYRAMAIPGGLAGYDPHRVGCVNDEMYFAPKEEPALAFGNERVRSMPGTEGVLLRCQVPSFMVTSSPPQGGDAVWPILKPTSFPDPARPDILPYVAELKTFQYDPAISRMF